MAEDEIVLPYYIAVAKPDYKRPCVSIVPKVLLRVRRTKVHEILTEVYLNALYDDAGFQHGDTSVQITDKGMETFFENYWKDGYMDNSIIELMYLENARWVSFDPSAKELEAMRTKVYANPGEVLPETPPAEPKRKCLLC